MRWIFGIIVGLFALIGLITTVNLVLWVMAGKGPAGAVFDATDAVFYPDRDGLYRLDIDYRTNRDPDGVREVRPANPDDFAVEIVEPIETQIRDHQSYLVKISPKPAPGVTIRLYVRSMYTDDRITATVSAAPLPPCRS